MNMFWKRYLAPGPRSLFYQKNKIVKENIFIPVTHFCLNSCLEGLCHCSSESSKHHYIVHYSTKRDDDLLFVLAETTNRTVMTCPQYTKGN
jgi:hypothetical protein